MSTAALQPLANALAASGHRHLLDEVVRATNERFALAGSWTRILAGERSLAFRLDTHNGPWFVKIEHSRPAELSGHIAELVVLAASHDVPTARPLASIGGRYAEVIGELVLSVSSWVDGTAMRAPVSTMQAKQIGAALGRLHRAFAELAPTPTLVTADEEPWLVWDRQETDASFARLEALIRQRGTDPNGFDQTALETLAERHSWLDALGQSLTALPPLTRQAGHGDFAAPNLLFDGENLVAVVDFSAASPQLVSYEIGRIAYGPEIMLSPEPETLAATFIDAYQEANPAVSNADIAHARACAFIQLARSIYPLDERYADQGRFPDDLDDFWLRRHRTARSLLTSTHGGTF
ncbi:Ser/Thr protein kinase RdoA involved in Cpx stress response, MazF antagonist [Brevibacterium sandarakinum]|uniref:Ser/Thr protein kinase RdoA involved in Cpx stress response, MazF antagonist n=1 Tax=Brevibacterium sandarakinum TaxID=629680 RepID=A0A1H1XDZ4_BRESA|nr:phosphotransferase [Brevibacterium sandarakinum]SDT07498.1 Ser/Thr protein kinase RdoA involved in Cpx stress response, MazF antagonist [Brevibacterium sandarakinum]